MELYRWKRSDSTILAKFLTFAKRYGTIALREVDHDVVIIIANSSGAIDQFDGIYARSTYTQSSLFIIFFGVVQ